MHGIRLSERCLGRGRLGVRIARIMLAALTVSLVIADEPAAEFRSVAVCDDGLKCTVRDRLIDGECRGVPVDCDDGLACTVETCDEGSGRCRYHRADDACLINGVCVQAGDRHPSNRCQRCDPRASGTSWSSGSDCDDEDPCTFGDRCVGGVCRGTPYRCDDQRNCTDDICDGRGGCRTEIAPGLCFINSICVSEGERHPNNPCRGCMPETSKKQWSSLFGTTCSGGFCADGRCLASLAVSRAGDGSGRIEGPSINCGDDCSHSFSPGTRVALSAIADEGSRFRAWSGACKGNDALKCEFRVSSAVAVTAVFETIEKEAVRDREVHDVVVRRRGRGRVMSRPRGIRCGRECRLRLPQGTIVVLKAKPRANQRLATWSGACSGSAAKCRLEVAGSADVEVKFERNH